MFGEELPQARPAAHAAARGRALRLLSRAAARITRAWPALIRWLARTGPIPIEARALEKATAAWISQAIAVAADLRMPDVLTAGPRTAAEVAEALALQPEAVARVLRVLASEGFLTQRADGFALTALGRALTSDHPGSVRELVAWCGAEWQRAIGELQRSLKYGTGAFEHVYGEPFFDYLAAHPTLQRSFNRGMRAASALADPTVPLAYDFSRYERVVDVGGGTGALLGTLLEHNPRLRGVLFDLAPVCDEAEQCWAEHPLAARMTFVRGDFRERVPRGGDLYVLKTILHDWGDAEAEGILRRCREAMDERSRLLIIEHALDPEPRPQFAQRLDLLMLSVLGGKERTQAEYQALLRAAGFHALRSYPTLSELTLLEAVPA